MKFSKEKIYFIVIILVTSFAYIGILKNGFVWDDHQFIEGWGLTRSFWNIPSVLKGATPPEHTGVYRPLRGLFYMISYKLWKLNPPGYHFQSMMIHLICTVLVYLIAVQITKKKTIGFMASLLFGTHPIHTEAVTPAASGFDLIGIVFFLASFYLYLKAESEGNKAGWIYPCSAVFAALAFFTYELTLTLPILIVFYDICFKRIKKESLYRRIKRYSPYLISAMVYLFIRFFILDIWGKGGYFAGSFYLTMLTMSKAFLKYIYLVIFPFSLNFNHKISSGILSYVVTDMNREAVIAQSVLDFNILSSIAVIIALLAIMMKGIKKFPLVSFCIGWFFIGLLPVSNIIPQLVVLSEKYLYIPSFGFCLLFSYLTYNLYSSISKKNKLMGKAIAVLFAFVVISYTITAIERNKDWRDDLALWSKTAERSPESAFAHNNLGWVLHLKGEKGPALEEYEKALKINPRLFEVYYNIGLIYQSEGKNEIAIEYYKKAISINPDYALPYHELGKAYYEQGMNEPAIEEYKKAISINPGFKEAYYNLGNAYHALGDIDHAMKEYRKALAIDPDYINALINLGNLYYIKGDIDMAITEYGKALVIEPGNDKARKNLELAMKEKGTWQAE
ncbi:tetratricopeptide repeat protein [Candidatus Woesearchaeota archaeon]|nr:tetratricopeptide repeat protein [Candidatus Woesearchaeota archaeon]